MGYEPQLLHLMTPFPYSVDVAASVAQAVQFLRTHKIRHLPVSENGVFKGLITDRDIKLMLGPDFAYPDERELKVGDVMVPECYVVDIDTPLRTVLREMANRRIGSAIVTRGGKLAGIFTAVDACKAFADYLEGTAFVDEDEEPPETTVASIVPERGT
jgi:CBS domain-containing protein